MIKAFRANWRSVVPYKEEELMSQVFANRPFKSIYDLLPAWFVLSHLGEIHVSPYLTVLYSDGPKLLHRSFYDHMVEIECAGCVQQLTVRVCLHVLKYNYSIQNDTQWARVVENVSVESRCI